jgi:hypothetical protein
MSRKCPKCGKEYPDGVTYCFNCKVKLIEASSDAKEGKIEYIDDNGRKKKKKISRKSLTFIVSALCVAAIGAAVLFATGSNGNNKDSDEVQAKSRVTDISVPESSAAASVSEDLSKEEISSGTESAVSENEVSKTSESSDISQESSSLPAGSMEITVYGKEDYMQIAKDMKAADDRLSLTTFDYSTFKVDYKFDYPLWCYSGMDTPGYAYSLTSDQFGGCGIMYAYETVSKHTSIACVVEYICDTMTDSEKQFFIAFLSTFLKTGYDTNKDRLEEFISYDGLTFTSKNAADYSFYEKQMKISNINFQFDVTKDKDGKIVSTTLNIQNY